MSKVGLTKKQGSLSVKVDLHLHSRFSRESDLWLLRQAGIGESTTDPETAYKVAKQRGMTYVTLTDHNTIEGGLRLAHHDDFFLSEEVTTYFPGEDVKLHLLAYGIREEQHPEIFALRRNLYELVDYLNQQQVLYVLAHPLTRLGGELTQGHLERLMLLFPIWEVHNGSTLERENLLSRRLAEQCTAEKLVELADKHGIEPVARQQITYTAGSDDHSGFDIASTYTATARIDSIAGYLAEIKAGRSTPLGDQGSTLKLAHTMLNLLAEGVNSVPDQEAQAKKKSLKSRLSLGLLGGFDRSGKQNWLRLASLAVGGESGGEILKAVAADGELRRQLLPLLTAKMQPGPVGGESFHNRLFSLVSAAWSSGMRSTIADFSEVTLFNFLEHLDKVGRLVALQVLLLPHSLSANYHSRQRHFLDKLTNELDGGAPPKRRPKVGLFTDTYDEVNGVTSILRRLAEFCGREGWPLDIISCSGASDTTGRVIQFPAVASVHLPEYGELDLSIPAVLEVVRHCEKQQFDVIHAATPGPMGLIACLVSKILQLPFVSSFHTDVPRCISHITDDKLNEEAAWTYTRWFYGRSDLNFVPSVYTSRDLGLHGLDQHKMAVLYQGIDCNRFAPEHRDPEWRRRLGGDDKKILLFVGRLSAEKDLRFLAQCYRELTERRSDIHLAFVGDGPLRGELEAALGESASFTGWLEGRELASAYAAADLFVFPSSVDTSGQVILEAQASGLPVVLCTEGGACENIEPGVSGLTAGSRDLAQFLEQIETLLDNDELRSAMALEARRVAEGRPWEKVFHNLFATYAELVNWWQPPSLTKPHDFAGSQPAFSTGLPLDFAARREAALKREL